MEKIIKKNKKQLLKKYNKNGIKELVSDEEQQQNL